LNKIITILVLRFFEGSNFALILWVFFRLLALSGDCSQNIFPIQFCIWVFGHLLVLNKAYG
jgi:hypothetical protein